MTGAISFDPTLHTSASDVGATSTATGPSGSSAAKTTASSGGTLQAFEGFLKKAGQTAGVVLADIVKYVIPVAQVAAVADPSVAPAVEAFTTSVHLVQATVLSAQQRWAREGSGANTQKLADVLTVVEQPIITLFAQIGVHVDTDYVVNLVNGVVAILNAQPAAVLQTKPE